MGLSKILDRLAGERTRLDVRVYFGGIKGISLDATLLEYDAEGYLFRVREGSGEKMTYVPKSALFNMKFAANPELKIEDVAAERSSDDSEGHSFMGVTYNSKTRELSGGGHSEFVKGEQYHRALSLLFEAGSDNPVSVQSLAGLPDTEEMSFDKKHSIQASISRMKKILQKFGLSTYAISDKGYTLGGISE